VASNQKVQVGKQDVEDVESFVSLGSYISRSGGTEEHIPARLGKALATYNKLGRIWKYYQFNNKPRSTFLSLTHSPYCFMYVKPGE